MAKEKKGLLYGSIEDRNTNLKRNLGGKYSEYHDLLVPAIGDAYDVFAREKKVPELSTGDTLNSLYYERLQTRLNNDVQDTGMVTEGQEIMTHENIPVYSKLGQISRQFEYLSFNKKALDNDAREISKNHITSYLPDILGLYSNNIYTYNDRWEAKDENGRNNYIEASFNDFFIQTLTPEDAQSNGFTYYYSQIQRSLEPSNNGAEWIPYNAADSYIQDPIVGKSIELRYIYPAGTTKIVNGKDFYTARTPYYKTVYNEVSDRFPINYTRSVEENHTLNGEIIQIDTYQTNATDLLGKTNYLYSQNKIDSLINRFHTTNYEGDNRSIIQTSVSQYGLSRGRNLLKATPDRPNSYENPYCRVWTSHYQYSKYKDTIRPFNNEGSPMTFEGYSEKIPGRLRPHKAGKRLDAYSSLDTSVNKPIIGPERDRKESIKRYMFSLENLAWKDSTDALSKEQIGPNGGRIMWFPPYDIKFSENVSTPWNTNDFIGRAEPIYTYTKTERTGTLSFKILVDHPSMADEMSRRELDSTDPEIEEEILRFFAGCDVPNYYVDPQYDALDPNYISNSGRTTTPDNSSQDAKPGDVLKVVYYTFFPNNYSGIDYYKNSAAATTTDSYNSADILTSVNDKPIEVGLDIMDYLVDNGLTLEEAAGVVGNWHQESRLDPTAIGDGNHSWGIAQWNDTEVGGQRAQKLQKFYGLSSLSDVTGLTWQQQTDFALASKSQGGEYLKARFSGKTDLTAEQAASIISAKYEICSEGQEGQSNNTHRKQLAKSYYAYYLQQRGSKVMTKTSRPEPMLYLLAGYGVNNKYADTDFTEYSEGYDSNPGYETTNTGISVSDSSEIIDKKWRYLVDEQQRKEILTKSENYYDTCSFGLNCDYNAVSSTDDITTKIIESADELYTLGEVYAALNSIDKENESSITDRVVSNGGRKDKIDYLVELFSDMDNEYYSIDVDTWGYASPHDTSNDNTTQNQALDDGRGEVAKDWVVTALKNKGLTMTIGGNIAQGEVATELQDGKGDVNTYNAKLARCAKTVITLTKKKTENIIAGGNEVNASTAKDVIAESASTAFINEYNSVNTLTRREISNLSITTSGLVDAETKNNNYYLVLGDIKGKILTSQVPDELFDDCFRLAIVERQISDLETLYSTLNTRLNELISSSESIKEHEAEIKELNDLMTKCMSGTSETFQYNGDTYSNKGITYLTTLKETYSSDLSSCYTENLPTNSSASQSQINSGSIELSGNIEKADTTKGKIGNLAENAYIINMYEKARNAVTEIGVNVDNEADYFKRIQNEDPVIYRTITEKIKHFDPAFHSISPEGFNARLTFLHQCTRQGPTTAVYSNTVENGNNDTLGTNGKLARNNERGMYPSNLAFGRAPYCILRIGDFYNTKILIDSLSIDYDQQQWDLNPEGIGVQPMIANINISFKFVGGSDIAGPIERLQNAVSFNFYANTSVYDRRADYHDVEDGSVILGDEISNNDLIKNKK